MAQRTEHRERVDADLGGELLRQNDLVDVTGGDVLLRLSHDRLELRLREVRLEGEHVGRYSFLGKDPFLILRGRGDETIIDRAGTTTRSDKPFIATLRELMNSFQSPFVPGLPRFTGGAVGYLGYDTAAWFEPGVARPAPADAAAPPVKRGSPGTNGD